MNLLTPEEFYITAEIKAEIDSNTENYNEIVNHFFPEDMESIPFLAFAYYSLKDYPNLLDKLSYISSKEEFSVNSYYYLLFQAESYERSEVPKSIANELARKDLLDIYNSYNQTPLVPGFDFQ